MYHLPTNAQHKKPSHAFKRVSISQPFNAHVQSSDLTSVLIVNCGCCCLDAPYLNCWFYLDMSNQNHSSTRSVIQIYNMFPVLEVLAEWFRLDTKKEVLWNPISRMRCSNLQKWVWSAKLQVAAARHKMEHSIVENFCCEHMRWNGGFCTGALFWIDPEVNMAITFQQVLSSKRELGSHNQKLIYSQCSSCQYPKNSTNIKSPRFGLL